MPVRLVILDVDGVIKQAPDPYMLVHQHLGTEELGTRYLNAFLDGAITYDEFAQLDAAAWHGRPVKEIKRILKSANPYVPGAFDLAQGLKQRRIPLILLSSGFDLHVEDVATDLMAIAYYCNLLSHLQGRLCGVMEVKVPPGAKAPLVRELLAQWDVPPSDCLIAGDSVSDIDTFHEVAHAVAVRPRTAGVSAAAQLTLPDLTGMISYIDSIS